MGRAGVIPRASSQDRRVVVGRVADVCPYCGQIRGCELIRVEYRVRASVVPVSAWMERHHVCRCLLCGQEWYVKRRDFQEVLDGDPDIEELMRRTNPSLNADDSLLQKLYDDRAKPYATQERREWVVACLRNSARVLRPLGAGDWTTLVVFGLIGWWLAALPAALVLDAVMPGNGAAAPRVLATAMICGVFFIAARWRARRRWAATRCAVAWLRPTREELDSAVAQAKAEGHPGLWMVTRSGLLRRLMSRAEQAS